MVPLFILLQNPIRHKKTTPRYDNFMCKQRVFFFFFALDCERTGSMTSRCSGNEPTFNPEESLFSERKAGPEGAVEIVPSERTTRLQ